MMKRRRDFRAEASQASAVLASAYPTERSHADRRTRVGPRRAHGRVEATNPIGMREAGTPDGGMHGEKTRPRHRWSGQTFGIP